MARVISVRHMLGLGTALAAIVMPSVAASAQSADQRPLAEEAAPAGNDIIVTANKRNSTIQDVPFSINAQTEEDIRRSGATTLEDLSRNVAGLAIQNLGPGQSQVGIRGVSAGQIARDQPGVKEQVGIYLDESADLPVAVHARSRPVRPQPCRDAARAAGHIVRLGFGRRHDPLHHQSAAPRRGRGQHRGQRQHRSRRAMSAACSRARSTCPSATRRRCAQSAITPATPASSTRSARAAARDKNVNDGERYGGRVSLLLQPTEDLSITPRFIYQKIDANGFNRQEVYNLYANPFTTTRPAIRLGEREQFLLLGERFTDELRLADLTMQATLQGISVTSVTSYTDRDILVSRDASALTGSVSVDLGFPTAGVLLPSNLRDTTAVKQFTQEVRLASDYAEPVPVGPRRLLRRYQAPVLRSACRRPGTTRSPTRASARARRWRSPTAFRSTRPTTPIFRTS